MSQSPTDSLNRPTELIPPGSPVRFQDLCNGKKNTADESPGEQEPSFGIPPGPGAESAAKDSCVNGSSPPECLTPTLEDCALSEMLVKVANKDKHYIGGEMINQQTEGVKLVGQTPTPDECLSPFWTKQFPGCGDDASKDGPGGEKKASSPSTAGSGKKKSPVTLNLAGNRIFVINNGRVVEDGSSLGRMKSSAASATTKEDNTGLRYYHAGMVMELIPGQTPSMKAVNAYNPEESIDCGSSMKEIIQRPEVITPIEKCFVESGFCAFLVLRYDDPESPKLEAMNSPTLHKTLKDLEGKGLTPSDEHFTPLVNIAREPAQSSQDDYTTALFFTTEKYTYYIYVENQSLALKKFKTGDPSWQAKPQNNKQFLDMRYHDFCDSNPHKGKEEVDAHEEGAKVVEKTRVDSSDTEDSAEGSSNPRSSCASSQLSSPEGTSISPSKSNILSANEKPDVLATSRPNDSETMDSGVEAN